MLQFHFRGQTYRLRLIGKAVLFFLFIIILCYMLGVWQLHRYHFKQHLLALAQEKLTPAALTSLSSQEDLQFRAVSVKGEYQNAWLMLVQNRRHEDTIGFEVLTPLKVKGENKWLIVDRGWVAQATNLPAAVDQASVEGKITLLNEYQFILGKNISAPNAKPLIMQKIVLAEISQITGQVFYPFILRLAPDAKNGFTRDWQVTTISPERHLGYAVQWFAIALALFIACGFFCCEKVEEKHVRSA